MIMTIPTIPTTVTATTTTGCVATNNIKDLGTQWLTLRLLQAHLPLYQSVAHALPPKLVCRFSLKELLSLFPQGQGF